MDFSNLTLDYFFDNLDEVLALTWEHLQLSLLALGLALLFAVPISALALRVPALATPVLGVLGVIYTIPSLAFFAVLVATPLGLGRDNAIVVLATYAQLFLVRNIVAGLRGVDPPTLEAARGIGLTPLQIFRQVQLPLAMPVIIAGIRTTLIVIVGLATLAAWVAAGGLGTLLFRGIPLRNDGMIVAGAVAITVLAIALDLIIRLLATQTAASRAARFSR